MIGNAGRSARRLAATALLALVAAAGLTATPAAAKSLSIPEPPAFTDFAPLPGAPAGAKAYRISYWSPAGTWKSGKRPDIVTAAIIVPRGRAPAAGRDIVVWAHGASGIAPACGLSDKPGLFAQIAGLDALLAAGYVVVAPDYKGLGSPGPHPFLVGTAAAQNIVAAVVATRAFVAEPTTNRYAVFGESLGAFSALWTASEADRHAMGLTLVGVAAAAPPTDLKANLGGGSNALVRAFLTAYTATSWEQVYNLPLSTVVKPRTATLIRNLAKNCVSLDGFKLRTKIGMVRLAGQLRTVDLAAAPRWAGLMAQNSVPSGIKLPVLIYQGGKDVIVAPAVTRAYAERLCRADVRVRYVVRADGDHVTAGKAAAPQVVPWLADRFAGKPAPSDCARL